MKNTPEDNEEDLLYLLNEIADLAIGNEAPVDVGFNEKTTLPELLAYVMIHPTNIKGLIAAEEKIKLFMEKVENIRDKIYVLKKKFYLKYKNVKVNVK